jgi:hypothetical protein
MSEDIGVNDVVERIDDESPPSPVWRLGDRARVLGVKSGGHHLTCGQCGATGPAGLFLDPHPSGVLGAWCINHWRKIGGSAADTVRLFVEDLTPARVDA